MPTPPIVVTEDDWRKDLNSKHVGYAGEEVSKCHELTWEQVLPSLPPLEHGGCIEAVDWVGVQTRRFLLNPHLILKNDDDIVLPRMPGRVHIKTEDKLTIAQELVKRRICSWLPLRLVHESKGQKILNGFFGVAKPAVINTGAPVLRLIMSLTGSNATQFQLTGGCNSLPSIASW